MGPSGPLGGTSKWLFPVNGREGKTGLGSRLLQASRGLSPGQSQPTTGWASQSRLVLMNPPCPFHSQFNLRHRRVCNVVPPQGQAGRLSKRNQEDTYAAAPLEKAVKCSSSNVCPERSFLFRPQCKQHPQWGFVSSPNRYTSPCFIFSYCLSLLLILFHLNIREGRDLLSPVILGQHLWEQNQPQCFQLQIQVPEFTVKVQ